MSAIGVKLSCVDAGTWLALGSVTPVDPDGNNEVDERGGGTNAC